MIPTGYQDSPDGLTFNRQIGHGRFGGKTRRSVSKDFTIRHFEERARNGYRAAKI
jgi:hypothetical protein